MTVTGIVSGLAYLIIPTTLGIEEAKIFGANVVPVFALAMYVMDKRDEAREDVYEELASLWRD